MNQTYSVRNLPRTSSRRRGEKTVIRINIKKKISSLVPSIPLKALLHDRLLLPIKTLIRVLIQRKMSRLLFLNPTTTLLLRTTSVPSILPLKPNHLRLPLYNNNSLRFKPSTTIQLSLSLCNTRHPLLQPPTMKHIHPFQQTKTILALLLVNSTNPPPVTQTKRLLRITQLIFLFRHVLPPTINLQPFIRQATTPLHLLWPV